MIEEQAIVVAIERDQAVLEVVRKSPCSLCGKTRGCGMSAWGKLLGHQRNHFRSENTISAHVGDQVIVGLDERALLSSAMIAYGVPLSALMLGAIIGNALAASPLRADLYALSGAVIGLLCGLLWLKAHSAGRGVNARYRPVILRPANMSETLVFCRQGG